MNLNLSLKNNPLLGVLDSQALQQLSSKIKIINFKTGAEFSLKENSADFVYLVQDGLLVSKKALKKDPVYFGEGTIIGNLPFISVFQRGVLQMLTPVTMLKIATEDFYHLLMNNYRSLRGYLKAGSKQGFELSNISSKIMKQQCRVISVINEQAGYGQTFFCSALSSLLDEEPTVVIAATTNGKSIFDYFEKKIPAPLAVREQNSNGYINKNVKEELVFVNDNLALLNFSHNATINVKPEILPLIIFLLAQNFNKIIIDVDQENEEMQTSAIKNSDFICTMVMKDKRNFKFLENLQVKANDQQQILKIYNQYLRGHGKNFADGYDVFRVPWTFTDSFSKEYAERMICTKLVDKIRQKNKVLALEPKMFNAFSYTSIFSHLETLEITAVYSSLFSYLFYLLVANCSTKERDERLQCFLNPYKFNQFLDVTFPGEYIFKNQRFLQFFSELFKDSSACSLAVTPVLNCVNKFNETVYLANGNLAKLATISAVTAPLFQQIEWSNENYSSDYSGASFNCLDVLRTPVDEFIFLFAGNSEVLISSDKIMPLYKNYLNNMNNRKKSNYFELVADKKLFLNLDHEKGLPPLKALKKSELVIQKLIKDI